jgi:hypothetical protein
VPGFKALAGNQCIAVALIVGLMAIFAHDSLFFGGVFTPCRCLSGGQRFAINCFCHRALLFGILWFFILELVPRVFRRKILVHPVTIAIGANWCGCWSQHLPVRCG